MAVVFIPTPLRRLTGGQPKVNLAATDIADLLEQLEANYPGLKARICEDDGQVKRFVNMFVNGQEIRTLQGLETALTDSDEIAIIPAMAGGAGLASPGR